MKTADLIPFILLELNEGDKYGFELTKEIENKSNGMVVIKQPTLYTLLKKLEKSKFISSYWQDSEIGGKRHYYKITENGKLQVSTLPSYKSLLENLVSDVENPLEISVEAPKSADRVSIMDELLQPKPVPAETILPSSEVFDETIDSATELEINSSNSEILKTENDDELFAANENVQKFTEKLQQKTSTALESNEQTTAQPAEKDILDINFTIPKNEIDIKYVDYQDLKNNDNYKYSKSITNKLLFKTIATSASLLLMVILCSVITQFTGRSGLYYFFFISSILISIFYPIVFAINMDNVRLKYQNQKHQSKTKLKLFIFISIVLLSLIVSVIVNISIGNNSLGSIVKIKNFENLYAPILLTSVCFLDLIFEKIFTSKKSNK